MPNAGRVACQVSQSQQKPRTEQKRIPVKRTLTPTLLRHTLYGLLRHVTPCSTDGTPTDYPRRCGRVWCAAWWCWLLGGTTELLWLKRHTVPLLHELNVSDYSAYRVESECTVKMLSARVAAARRRSQWPSGLRRGPTTNLLLGLRVRTPPGVWMSVSCKRCVLPGRGLCVEPITQPEVSLCVM